MFTSNAAVGPQQIRLALASLVWGVDVAGIVVCGAVLHFEQPGWDGSELAAGVWRFLG